MVFSILLVVSRLSASSLRQKRRQRSMRP
jgi:hypothetical protein